jgi:hypothetical protein
VILVLDDDPGRHRAFQQGLIGANVRHCVTAAECIAQLQDPAQPVPSTVFLDHDLDQHGLPASIAGTGMDVAAFLAGRSRCRRSHVVVHSINPAKGPAMALVLRRSGCGVEYVPWAWMDDAVLARAVRRDRGA